MIRYYEFFTVKWALIINVVFEVKHVLSKRTNETKTEDGPGLMLSEPQGCGHSAGALLELQDTACCGVSSH